MIVIPPNTVTLNATNVAQSQHPDWASGTMYSVGDRVYYVGEEPVRIYEATQSTTGDVPPDSPAQWTLVTSSNRWSMFDGGTSTRTERSTSIDVTVSTAKADRIALFGLTADTVRVVAKDGTTVIDDTTHDTAGLNTFVAVLPGLFLNLTVEVTISATTAQCAHLVVGLSKQ